MAPQATLPEVKIQKFKNLDEARAKSASLGTKVSKRWPVFLRFIEDFESGEIFSIVNLRQYYGEQLSTNGKPYKYVWSAAKTAVESAEEKKMIKVAGSDGEGLYQVI